jgi:LAS superfamily LD-carboxypeptidase LdcB
VTSVYRSYSEQLQLWNNRHRNPYPVAPPGRSYHQLRRAWDMNGPREDLLRAGRTWKSWGGSWSESDVIHFQA